MCSNKWTTSLILWWRKKVLDHKIQHQILVMKPNVDIISFTLKNLFHRGLRKLHRTAEVNFSFKKIWWSDYTIIDSYKFLCQCLGRLLDYPSPHFALINIAKIYFPKNFSVTILPNTKLEFLMLAIPPIKHRHFGRRDYLFFIVSNRAFFSPSSTSVWKKSSKKT